MFPYNFGKYAEYSPLKFLISRIINKNKASNLAAYTISHRCRGVEHCLRESAVTAVQYCDVALCSSRLFHLHHSQLLHV